MISVLLLAAAATAAGQDLTICADRPSKANGTCTVPAEHWQLEVSGIDWARTENDGTRTDVSSFGQTFVKLGLTSNSDVELVTPAYVLVHSTDRISSARVSSLGDASIRFKLRLTDADSSMQAAVIPFVKLPTASRSIGNGKVEGGVAVPLSFATKAGLTVTIGPEVDVVADADGRGYHAALINLINVGISPIRRFSLSAELWNETNVDPARTIHLWSADLSVAYLSTSCIQIDGGANFGLSRATPDAELYLGASLLF
jgi:hypothetical protein